MSILLQIGDETRLDKSEVVFITVGVFGLFEDCAQVGACLGRIGNASSVNV